MTLPVVALLAALTFAIGYAFATLLSRSRTASLAEQRRTLEQQLAAAKETMASHAAEIRSLSDARSALNATLATERKNAEEKLRLLADAGEHLKSDFKALAAAALDSNNASFLQLAKTALKNSQTEAAGALAQREQAVQESG